ncbi:hypothetical protein IV487_03460 [Enterococcus saccharolyticus]|uniref:TraX family protein n=1 Tax=Enterococcus saccharolyticus TaxID=41997 RepID=UPI001E617CDC|nr:TraX family protein [Enterococcus saccharolyticus]MCD5001526.1 hypothetical protein [Enterococcus saccharolyticus]
MEKKFSLTGYQIKLIGIILMVGDHVYEMFNYVNPPTILNMFGRIVLPIFLFMSAEGFYYTRNRLKYMSRLLIGFWGMNLGNLVIPKIFPMNEVTIINNVFGTLFLATLVMYSIEACKQKQWVKGIALVLLPLLIAIPFLVTMSSDTVSMASVYLLQVFPSYLTVEGGFLSVLLGVLFYLLREKRALQFLALLVVSVVTTGFDFSHLLSNYQWMMVFAVVPLALYNGQKGRGDKYFFYTFYPTHIYGLYILSYFYLNYWM